MDKGDSRRRPMLLLTSALFLCLLICTPIKVGAITLYQDTVWQGNIDIREDVLVPKGVTLTILPKTLINVHLAQSTKIKPEFVSPLTEITIRGTLVVEGEKDAPVHFSLAESAGGVGKWAGLIIDQGRATIRFGMIRDSEVGLRVFNGTVELFQCRLGHNRYGLVGYGRTTEIAMNKCHITENVYGMFLFDNARITKNDSIIAGNQKKESYLSPAQEVVLIDNGDQPTDIKLSRTYEDDVLVGTTIWQGRIVVKGQVRLPVDARLIILPGTLIEFSKKDTNNDFIGENGLFIQGILIAKGTKESPIFFRSGETVRRPGDWDAINILGSDHGQNLIEYCQIEDAYRGLHLHFANVAINHCRIFNNYRAVQFQESLVSIGNNLIYGNKSAIRARDSEVLCVNNRIFNNLDGVHFFRLDLLAVDNNIFHNINNGMRIREGISTVERNNIFNNRFGMLINDVDYGKFSGNLLAHNLETGLLLKDTDHVEVSGNIIQKNGINGISITASRAVITSNLISDNSEKGIGISSFSGIINNNNLVSNGQYAISTDGNEDVKALMNWWGGSDLDKEIYDNLDDPSLGMVLHSPQKEEPFQFSWPLRQIPCDIFWHGAIVVPQEVTVEDGATLTVQPGTTVSFKQNIKLKVFGQIQALGNKKKKILFNSVRNQGAGDWYGILLEKAAGSSFSHCQFENATWSIHSHFVDLKVSECTFVNNKGGIKFRSGPVDICCSVFTNNSIGIRAFWGNGSIYQNTITNNEIGFFVRQGGGGLAIHRNNIVLNEKYGIRVGDFNVENVDARQNWWGERAATESIFDGRIEDYIGTVLVEPVLTEPVTMN